MGEGEYFDIFHHLGQTETMRHIYRYYQKTLQVMAYKQGTCQHYKFVQQNTYRSPLEYKICFHEIDHWFSPQFEFFLVALRGYIQ